MVGLAAAPAAASLAYDEANPPDLQSWAAEFESDLTATDRDFHAVVLEVTDRDFDGIVLAHSGQLSTKDGCHKSKAEGRRHYHADGGATVAGSCESQDGVKYRVPDVEAVEDKPPWVVCSGAWQALQTELREFWGDVDEAADDLLACLSRAYAPEQ